MGTIGPNDGFEYYLSNFPSDTFLEKLVGSRRRYLLSEFRRRQDLLKKQGPLRIYSNGASLNAALESGELRESRNPFHALFSNTLYVIDWKIFSRRNDPFVEIRRDFDESIRSHAVEMMRRSAELKGILRRIYLFDCGAYGEAVAAQRLPENTIAAHDLAREFTEMVEFGNVGSPDPWWKFGTEGKITVYMGPLPNAVDHVRAWQERIRKNHEARAERDKGSVARWFRTDE